MDASREALQNVRDLIRYGVSRFNQTKLSFGHGSDNAWDEAVYLVLSALHLPPDQLEPFMDARVLPKSDKKHCNISMPVVTSGCRRPTSPTRPGSRVMRFMSMSE